jgi:hypothetical protein
MIDMLHDDVLLATFDFCVAGEGIDHWGEIESWQSLVQVCRRWRILVFGSPRRLNLRLVCTLRTHAREILDVWPALHLVIQRGSRFSKSMDNIVVALGHRDRVSSINLMAHPYGYGDLQWDKVLAAMQVPFPALTNLQLECGENESIPIVPDTFLGGSVPRLQHLRMEHIPFPGIPRLLLSSTQLVTLHLFGISHSGYFSSEAMATCLSMLTNLDSLSLSFLSPQPHPDRENRHPPSTTCSVLPNLTRIYFKGTSKYLEDLVAWVDAPQLHNLFIVFFPQINFDTPHLFQFISRTPRFKEPFEAIVGFDSDAVDVRYQYRTSDIRGKLCVQISYEESDGQLSSIAQICVVCLPPFGTVENLRVISNYYESGLGRCQYLDWTDGFNNDQWLELLRPFTGVKSLYVSEEFLKSMVFALQELVGGRTTEVLPSLQNIFLAGFMPTGSYHTDLQEAIGQFIAARQLSGDPIAIFSGW